MFECTFKTSLTLFVTDCDENEFDLSIRYRFTAGEPAIGVTYLNDPADYDPGSMSRSIP